MSERRLPLLAILALSIILLTPPFFRPHLAVTGKGTALPLPDGLTAEQKLAQELALADPRVQALGYGRRTEVMGIGRVGAHFPASSAACATAPCWQVDLYNWPEDAAVTALVDVAGRQVLDVFHQPGVRPGLNQRNIDRALAIALNAPEVRQVLGYRPVAVDMAPVPADLLGSVCDQGHYCVGPTINLGDRVLWMIVDLTDGRLAGLAYTDFPPQREPEPWVPELGCEPGGSVARDGWQVSYEVTNHDGLRVFDAAFNGLTLLHSSKLVEWHADYGASGFRDETGCQGGGGGFAIFPYGDTRENTLYQGPDPVGFELVQDFRMNSWGANCNYRYEQHYQFFDDGRFRVVAGAYGRGCGSGAIYRPVIRIDIALGGQENEQVSYWDGSVWVAVASERWFLPSELQNFDGLYPLQIRGGPLAYYLEPGQGQFGDGGRGDEPFIYITRYQAAEGATNLGVIGSCCHDDHRQGPDQYVNGEDVAGENIVLWYVSQSATDAIPGSMYCWTVTGEPAPETYPCFTGPLFVPAFNLDYGYYLPIAR